MKTCCASTAATLNSLISNFYYFHLISHDPGSHLWLLKTIHCILYFLKCCLSRHETGNTHRENSFRFLPPCSKNVYNLLKKYRYPEWTSIFNWLHLNFNLHLPLSTYFCIKSRLFNIFIVIFILHVPFFVLDSPHIPLLIFENWFYRSKTQVLVPDLLFYMTIFWP